MDHLELMDEDFLDAYEFIGNPVPEIKELIRNAGINLGRPIPTDDWRREKAAEKIGKIVKKLPVQKLDVQDIIRLNNLANLPEDTYTLEALKKVSGKDGYKQQYINEMLKRDKRDYRDREFPLDPIIQAVEDGSIRPLLIAEVNNVQYVIDGRTRLYAAIAANKSINVKVLNEDALGGLND